MRSKVVLTGFGTLVYSYERIAKKKAPLTSSPMAQSTSVNAWRELCGKPVRVRLFVGFQRGQVSYNRLVGASKLVVIVHLVQLQGCTERPNKLH